MGQDNKTKNKAKYLDKAKYSLPERKAFYKEDMEKIMNPFPSFDPDNFEPIGPDYAEITDRGREQPPKQLPTFGLKPKKIREGQMIGMYESKQDLYLIMAHRINELQVEIDLLKSQIL